MYLVGQVLLVLAIFMLIPYGYSIVFETPYFSFLVTFIISVALGVIFLFNGKQTDNYSLRDGFLVVSTIWILGALLSALPFYFSGILPSFIDSLFESVSGITATGATVVKNVDALPKTFILWRSITHWLGGMGIVVLVLAFLKNLGADAAHFFQAEASVPRPGVVVQRIKLVAMKLWYIYLFFTATCFVALWVAGMSAFDSINFAFSTIATGGFAPTTVGALAYSNNFIISSILIFFMIIAGGNFTVYYAAYQKGIQEIWRDFEFRIYLGSLLGGGLIVLLALVLHSHSISPNSILEAFFTLISLQTGSGFAVQDYTEWIPLAQMMLLLATFFGGCSGSTTGGIKIIRIIILIKSSVMYLRKAIHPDMVQLVRVNGKPLPNKWLQVTQQFFFLYLLTFAISCVCMASTGLSIGDSIGCVAGVLGNVGLGFGILGPNGSFGILSDFAKYVCVIDMLLGRLELFTLLVLLHPKFWEGYFTPRNDRESNIIQRHIIRKKPKHN